MPDAPLHDPANLFIWIVCILIGLATAVVAIDNLPKRKRKMQTVIDPA